MSLQILHPPGWLPPIGYANGISVVAGRIVFIAGQVGWDANQHFQSEELVPQFEQALKNILAVLAQAGGIPSHICRLTAFCIDKPAYLAGRRDLAHLEFADGKSFPRDEHDFCCRPSRRPGKDRAGSDRRHSRLKN